MVGWIERLVQFIVDLPSMADQGLGRSGGIDLASCNVEGEYAAVKYEELQTLSCHMTPRGKRLGVYLGSVWCNV